MNDLRIFASDQFGEMRTVQINGEWWFVLKDVCAALGISDHITVGKRLDSDEVGQTHVIDTRGRKQKMTIVNESGLYNVVLRSDKPNTKPFKRWVTHDILPTLRKTGSYSVSDAVVARVDPPAVPLGALVKMLEYQERVMRAKGCDYNQISAAAKGLMDAYGVPVTKAFAQGVDPQMCLFEPVNVELPVDALVVSGGAV